MRKYDKTKKGIVTKIFGHQIERSAKKEKIYVSYTKQELTEWMMEQTIFHTLFDVWTNSGHIKELKPSVDRIDDMLGYSLDNIQLMTFIENKTKGHESCKKAIVSSGKKHRRVIRVSEDGDVLGSYISINEASRITGVGSGNIASCVNINKCQHKAGGFIWRYDDR